MENLELALEDTKDNIDVEAMNKATYIHMLERMKKDFIATKIKSTEMEVSLRSKSQILTTES